MYICKKHGELKTEWCDKCQEMKLWDSFTEMAIKKGGVMTFLGKLFQEHTFKKQLLSNDRIAEIYSKL